LVWQPRERNHARRSTAALILQNRSPAVGLTFLPAESVDRPPWISTPEGAVRAPLRRDRRTERRRLSAGSDSVYFLRRDLGAVREAIRISPRSKVVA